MNTGNDISKRFSMLGDQHLRKKHPLILGLSGASFATSASVSVLNLQEYLLKNMPDVLKAFPEYEAFFTISTWLSFVAGVIFFIIPTTFTVWLSGHLVSVSILYLLASVNGIASLSFWAFAVPYWGWVIATLIPELGDPLKFYFKNTYIDGYVLIIFKLVFLIWAIILYNNLIL